MKCTTGAMCYTKYMGKCTECGTKMFNLRLLKYHRQYTAATGNFQLGYYVSRLQITKKNYGIITLPIPKTDVIINNGYTNNYNNNLETIYYGDKLLKYMDW